MFAAVEDRLLIPNLHVGEVVTDGEILEVRHVEHHEHAAVAE
jgi:hypothetical protein